MLLKPDRLKLLKSVEMVCENLLSKRAVEAVATSDVVFGCMDGVEGRHLLNRLAAYYLLPYFDVGVKLEADGNGGINEACGAVHYSICFETEANCYMKGMKSILLL